MAEQSELAARVTGWLVQARETAMGRIVNGIDDGRHKYASPVLFAIWNALKAEGAEMPYPHRVVEFKGAVPQGAA